jgi:SRSO17 transposase
MVDRPAATVGLSDDYCNYYQALFSDVRNFEAFKLHIGMISEPPKSLPAIARSVGLPNPIFTHFFANAPWQVEGLRARRLG